MPRLHGDSPSYGADTTSLGLVRLDGRSEGPCSLIRPAEARNQDWLLLPSIGVGWAAVIDTLTMCPNVRRKVVRMLAEIDAAE